MKDTHWRRWEIVGLLWTLAAGNLLHFVYDWTGQSVAAGLFSAVNESTWEHMKLLAVPWILFSLAEYIAVRSGGVAAPRAAGLLVGLAAVLALALLLDRWAAKSNTSTLPRLYIVMMRS